MGRISRNLRFRQNLQASDLNHRAQRLSVMILERIQYPLLAPRHQPDPT